MPPGFFVSRFMRAASYLPPELTGMRPLNMGSAPLRSRLNEIGNTHRHCGNSVAPDKLPAVLHAVNRAIHGRAHIRRHPDDTLSHASRRDRVYHHIDGVARVHGEEIPLRRNRYLCFGNKYCYGSNSGSRKLLRRGSREVGSLPHILVDRSARTGMEADLRHSRDLHSWSGMLPSLQR